MSRGLVIHGDRKLPIADGTSQGSRQIRPDPPRLASIRFVTSRNTHQARWTTHHRFVRPGHAALPRRRLFEPQSVDEEPLVQ